MNVSKLIGLTFIAALLFTTASAAHADGGGSVSCSDSKIPGCVLAIVDGVEVRYNGMDPWAVQDVTEYGSEYQCVELIQRYYAQVHNYPAYWMPYYAYQVFEDWGHPASMKAYPNGSSTPPQRGDILVFGSIWYAPYGHVAIVESVEKGRIKFAQENVMDLGEDSLPIDSHNVIQSDGAIYSPVRGWLRDESHPAAQPGPAVSVVQEESANLGASWWLQLSVSGNGLFRVELDGAQVLSGDGGQKLPWTLLPAGYHTIKLYADPGGDRHFSYGWASTPQPNSASQLPSHDVANLR
ncbi:MAG: CHAP domain-containing protein [Rudaea sp.]